MNELGVSTPINKSCIKLGTQIFTGNELTYVGLRIGENRQET